MRSPHRQMERLLSALEEVRRRNRLLMKAQLASKLALEKAVREGEGMLQIIAAAEAVAAYRHIMRDQHA